MKSALYVATTTSAYSRALKWCSMTSREKWNEKLIDLSKVLEKIPHRGYTEASLEKQAGLDSIYNGKRNGDSTGYQIAGIVLEVKKGESFVIQTENTFDQKNILEVLDFDGNVIELQTKHMRSLNNTKLERSKPSSLLRFSWPKSSKTSNYGIEFSNIEPLNVVRFKSRN